MILLSNIASPDRLQAIAHDIEDVLLKLHASSASSVRSSHLYPKTCQFEPLESIWEEFVSDYFRSTGKSVCSCLSIGMPSVCEYLSVAGHILGLHKAIDPSLIPLGNGTSQYTVSCINDTPCEGRKSYFS